MNSRNQRNGVNIDSVLRSFTSKQMFDMN